MRDIGRRAIIGAVAGVIALRPNTGHTAIDPYDTLISGQYANNIKLLQQIGGNYIGENFDLTSSPTVWKLELGRYRGKLYGRVVDIHGYWIFNRSSRKCWQAVNRGNGPLVYWNEDGKATGNPEDWEIFQFKPVSKLDRTVKIFNPAFYEVSDILGTPISARRGFIGLTGNRFACDADFAGAAVFTVDFS